MLFRFSSCLKQRYFFPLVNEQLFQAGARLEPGR